MYSIVSTAIVRGIESIPIRVEADVTDGMPVFEMVGFLSAEVREARERVRTALKNCGYRLPPKRITINLSPAYVRKSGSSFDLPVAVAVLAQWGLFRRQAGTASDCRRSRTGWKNKTDSWSIAHRDKGCTGADGRLYGAGGKCQRSCIGKRNPSVWCKLTGRSDKRI